jgi:hypothetical protein
MKLSSSSAPRRSRRDLAFKRHETERESWKPQGKLEMWRVAYAAAFARGSLNHDQAMVMACGAGLPAGIPGVTKIEVDRAFERARFYQEQRWGDDKERARLETAAQTMGSS